MEHVSSFLLKDRTCNKKCFVSWSGICTTLFNFQTKGKTAFCQWHFGLKTGIQHSPSSSLLHSLTLSPSNTHFLTPTLSLTHTFSLSHSHTHTVPHIHKRTCTYFLLSIFQSPLYFSTIRAIVCPTANSKVRSGEGMMVWFWISETRQEFFHSRISVC